MKSPGPDGIRVQALKNHAMHLANIFYFIFQLSLQWHKRSHVFGRTKTQRHSITSDQWPLPLLSWKLLKSWWRVHFWTLYRVSWTLQFAYGSGRGINYHWGHRGSWKDQSLKPQWLKDSRYKTDNCTVLTVKRIDDFAGHVVSVGH